MSTAQETQQFGLSSNLVNYGDPEFALFLRKAFIKGAGYSDDALQKRIIGIINTSSGYNPCHGNINDLIEAAKRGVQSSGALLVEFPTISLHESFCQPTSMYLRNLMSIDTEEQLKAQPMDACILVGGCDKTVPAQLMGAISADVPVVQLVTGSMLTGSFRGERIGACTDCRRYWAMYRGEEIDVEDISLANDNLVSSVGTCGVMGTASTMACIAVALGMMPISGASPPAVSSARMRVAEVTGRLAVEIAKAKRTPSQILSFESFENAVAVLQAIGGSTNAIVHLLAIAGRSNVDFSLDTFHRIGRHVPVLVDLKPSGEHYMEDFHRAGGMGTLLRIMKPLLHLNARTVTGRTLGEEIDQAPKSFPQTVIRSLQDPIYPSCGLTILRGNLAPYGAALKQSAASASLLQHSGRAVVFENLEDLALRIDDEQLKVTPESVLVLKNIGPKGACMPEAGYIPIPKKLLRMGVKDMVRISDGRMSGTAAGTVVLHISPESAIGGPLWVVRNGDVIRLDAPNGRLELDISPIEMRNRLAEFQEPLWNERGFMGLHKRCVLQADQGADFDFLLHKSKRVTAGNRVR